MTGKPAVQAKAQTGGIDHVTKRREKKHGIRASSGKSSCSAGKAGKRPTYLRLGPGPTNTENTKTHTATVYHPQAPKAKPTDALKVSQERQQDPVYKEILKQLEDVSSKPVSESVVVKEDPT